ncbi:hypothetical protein BJV82DRAFT_614763 [Fennellomyces sp. T-0311]|nr:hypothetical protein BJV82DRAFT_614763 [Fennellomyces sp. T-0311]
MSVNSSTTVFLNNIFVNNTFGESIDFDNNLFQRADQPDIFPASFEPSFEASSCTAAPINIPNTTSSYEHLSPYATHNNHGHFYSPISTSDDSFCLSPAADSDFLSAASPASSLGSFMAPETFLTPTEHPNYFQQDFCLNDSFTIPTFQLAEEEAFLPTPVSASPALSYVNPEYSSLMMLSPSLDPIMDQKSHTEQQQQQQHRRSRRRSPKIHTCPHCPHVSNRLNNMKEHILTHNPNRPKRFACHLCGKRFARKHDMKRHSKSPHSP